MALAKQDSGPVLDSYPYSLVRTVEISFPLSNLLSDLLGRRFVLLNPSSFHAFFLFVVESKQLQEGRRGVAAGDGRVGA